jgi:TetR/AcrR family transcriptional repressor of nem operon
MARPKEFDRDEALQRAIVVFCEKGYAAASTDELMRAMSISRQSMYDTFGDKRHLYMEAFRKYNADSVSKQIRLLEDSKTALGGIEGMLLAIAQNAECDGSIGCMGVNAICEFGRSDTELALLGDAEGLLLFAALDRALRRAKADKEIGKAVNLRTAAHFLLATLVGLKVAAKNGANQQALKKMAAFALRSLTGPV